MDSAGYTIQTETDVTNDGKVDKVTLYTLDVHGNVLQKLDYNQLADGSLVQIQREEYTLDGNGNRIGMTRYPQGSETPSVIETYEVNALGQRTKALIDNYGDKVVDRAETYTLDANGRNTKTEYDSDMDGQTDAVRYYTNDALGRVIVNALDSDNDGNIDQTTTTTRDVYGQDIVSTTTTSAGGSTTYYNEYDAIGQKTVTITDNNSDGVMNTRREYTYDQYGNVSTETVINSTTGAINHIYYNLEYSSDNLLTKRHYDQYGNGDSANDTIITYTYDDVWKTEIGRTETYVVSGKINFITETELNNAGQALRTYTDIGGDGQIDRLNYGNYQATTGVSFTDDLTTWTTDQIVRIQGLDTIRLSSNTASTEITLDVETIAKIAPKNNQLLIWGDATDTVNLEGFIKTGTNSAGNHTYYTAEVAGTTYTLQVDTVIDTNVI